MKNSGRRICMCPLPWSFLKYYVYKNNLEDALLKKTGNIQCKDDMRRFLCIALLKGVFGGQTDAVLTKIRNVIKTNNGTSFPLSEIVESFRGQDRNFNFDDDFIDSLLKTQKESPSCYPILSLLYSHMNFENDCYHKDHLHPASSFSKKHLLEVFGSEEKIPEYYTNPEFWNGIVNLQLLNSGLNISKNDEPLAEWLSKKEVNLETQLIPSGVSYEFKDFVEFYNKRKELLVNKLKDITAIRQ